MIVWCYAALLVLGHLLSALCRVGCDVQYGTAVVCTCIEGCFLDSEVSLIFIWRYHWPDVLVKQVYQC